MLLSLSSPCHTGVRSRTLWPRTAERGAIPSGHALYLCWCPRPLPGQAHTGYKRRGSGAGAGPIAAVGPGWACCDGPEQSSAVCSTVSGTGQISSIHGFDIQHNSLMETKHQWKLFKHPKLSNSFILFACLTEEKKMNGHHFSCINAQVRCFFSIVHVSKHSSIQCETVVI